MTQGQFSHPFKSASNLAKNFPEHKDIKVKTDRLESLLTRTMVPTLGLHLALLAAVFYFSKQPQLFKNMFGLFAVSLTIIALRTAIKGLSVDPIFASRQTTAIFMLSFLTLLSTPFGQDLIQESIYGLSIVYPLLLLAYCAVSWIYLRGYMQPLSLVVIENYTLLFAYLTSPQQSFLLLASLCITCIAIGGAALRRAKETSYLVGFAVSGLIVVIISLNDRNFAASLSFLAGFSAIVVIAFFVYELATKSSIFSDFLKFLTQGVMVALFLTVAVAIDQTRTPQSQTFTAYATAGLFALYSLIATFALRKNGLASRLTWLIILSGSTMFLEFGFNIKGMIVCGLCLTLIFLVSKYLDNAFAGAATVFASFFLLGALLKHSDTTFYVSEVPRDTSEVSASVETEIYLATFNNEFAIVIILLCIPLIVSSCAPPSRGLPWWQGVIRPRYALTMRNIFHSISNQLKNAPILGWFVSLALAVKGLLTYLKGDRRLTARDTLAITAHIVAAFCTSFYLDVLIPTLRSTRDNPILESTNIELQLGWLIWGSILSLRSYLNGQLLYRLAGFGFFCVPLIEFISMNNSFFLNPEGMNLFLELVIYCALPIYLVSLLPFQQKSDDL